MSAPYYEQDGIRLYHGDCRDLLPSLRGAVLIVDPPYAETNLRWDHWPVGWVGDTVGTAPQMWCFGSMRMFLDRRDEFGEWTYAQEVVWEKHNGSSFHADRFRRVHELVTHWYCEPWETLTRNVQTTPDATARTVRKKARPPQWHGATGDTVYRSQDGGPRMMRSVLRVRSEHGRALHPTQKPLGILAPLIAYSTNPGDVVLDPFAGAGSVLLAARLAGRSAIGVEIDERYCEIAAARLAQGSFAFGSA
jgi:site-specific DNA-methyltransferase (adenine-specific)